MILVIDNYDSFTYNLVQYLKMIGERIEVRRNDQVSVADIEGMSPDALVLSPGPCTPSEAGVCVEAVEKLCENVPILGVCLGHQSIAKAMGGRVVRASRLMHGKTSPILHDGNTVYDGLPSPFEAGRYHSLIVEESSLPDCMYITARTPEEEVMGIRHRTYPLEGIQFHPESVLTPVGMKLLENFVKSVSGRRRQKVGQAV